VHRSWLTLAGMTYISEDKDDVRGGSSCFCRSSSSAAAAVGTRSSDSDKQACRQRRHPEPISSRRRGATGWRMPRRASDARRCRYMLRSNHS
jgi:hypothetical protein